MLLLIHFSNLQLLGLGGKMNWLLPKVPPGRNIPTPTIKYLVWYFITKLLKSQSPLPEGQQNQCEALYIINSVGIAYHQNAVLYIIKPTEIHTCGVMRYNNGKPLLMTYSFADYIRLMAITCQSFGLDKKQRTSKEVLCFLAVRLILEPELI